MSTDFKKKLKRWYCEINRLFTDDSDIQQKAGFSKFTSFVYNILLDKQLDASHVHLPLVKVYNYLESEIINSSLSTTQVLMLQIGPGLEYILLKDRYGYIFLSEHLKPIRKKLSDFLNQLIFAYQMMYNRAEYIDVKMVLLKTIPLDQSISTYLYKTL